MTDTERRVLLTSAAFLDSPQSLAITGASTPQIREIAQRYLTACYHDLGKAPRLLDGDDLKDLLQLHLPRHFGVRDPLAPAADEVLAALLVFLDETEVVPSSYEQHRALDEHAPAFQAAVAAGTAHQDGLAATSRPKTIVHRADKTGRNDPCPCGSGRKFKKCCMGIGGTSGG